MYPSENLTVPHSRQLFGVGPGLIIEVRLVPSPNCQWFSINFQCSDGNIALRINPVFQSTMSRIARNSLINGQWGVEESFGHFPLLMGQSCVFLVLIESGCFKIAINGQHYTEFAHRVPMQTINNLNIDGQCQLTSIQIEGGGQQPPQVGWASGTAPSAPPMSGAPPPPPPLGFTGPGPQPLTQPYGGGYPPQQPVGGVSAVYHQPQAYPAQQAYPKHHQQPYLAPQKCQTGGRISPSYGKMAGAGIGGAIAGAALSKLVYPGHHHGMGPMGMMMGKKHKKLFKHKHRKMKFGKPKKWGKHCRSSSSSSSSSSCSSGSS